MTRDEIVAMFERRRAAWVRQDVDALAADYRHDSIIESPIGGLHHGPSEAAEVFRRVFEALELHLQQQSILIDGHQVAEAILLEGKDAGPFLGLPPTGKTFRGTGVFLYNVEGGHITRERRIYDFTGLLVQAGLLKLKPSS